MGFDQSAIILDAVGVFGLNDSVRVKIERTGYFLKADVGLQIGEAFRIIQVRGQNRPQCFGSDVFRLETFGHQQNINQARIGHELVNGFQRLQLGPVIGRLGFGGRLAGIAGVQSCICSIISLGNACDLVFGLSVTWRADTAVLREVKCFGQLDEPVILRFIHKTVGVIGIAREYLLQFICGDFVRRNVEGFQCEFANRHRSRLQRQEVIQIGGEPDVELVFSNCRRIFFIIGIVIIGDVIGCRSVKLSFILDVFSRRDGAVTLEIESFGQCDQSGTFGIDLTTKIGRILLQRPFHVAAAGGQWNTIGSQHHCAEAGIAQKLVQRGDAGNCLFIILLVEQCASGGQPWL